MVIAPVVLLVVTAMNTALQHQTFVSTLLERRLVGDAMVFLFTTVPYVALWFVFAFFYAFLPNTRVRIVPALIGGVVGGTLWQVAQWAYIDFQIGVTRYQTIYGALAQLPVFMVWIYMSWVVTLLGAELSRACQHGALMSLIHIPRYASMYVREWLASELYFSLAQRFMTGAGPWSAATFARRHQVPIDLVQEVLAPLREKQFLVEMASHPDHYVPGRDPATLTPWEILRALRHDGDTRVEDVITQQNTLATRLLTRLEASMQEVAGTQSIAQWLEAVDNTSNKNIPDERTKPCD
jgi:membrane protein